MDLTPYVDGLREELLAAAEPGEASELARRLVASVASATRLTMLDVLSAAADEITRELVPGSVEVRLRDRNPHFVVTPGAIGEAEAGAAPEAPDVPAPVPGGKDGAVSRINFRPPEQLKQRIEAAAGEAGLSVNAWLIQAVGAALAGDRRTGRNGGRTGRFTGWVG
ncbi:toxin-antitoxin system HicB family antitoxin [Nocardia terpenica]|uniref:Histidine kinase n=1 Tax=Nocardia terpenica TaxID=455432 RepID=A0A164MJC0_9NOCA|nr:toxin-antitoxin system HicB family antitoxin [Nocardia terpenica]KZM73409.1 histidine kinase [Nocardia terpenica]NQE87418.1 toxin-antitoxin system HicB family antitoxin [Nocardia terpenica]